MAILSRLVPYLVLEYQSLDTSKRVSLHAMAHSDRGQVVPRGIIQKNSSLTPK